MNKPNWFKNRPKMEQHSVLKGSKSEEINVQNGIKKGSKNDSFYMKSL